MKLHDPDRILDGLLDIGYALNIHGCPIRVWEQWMKTCESLGLDPQIKRRRKK